MFAITVIVGPAAWSMLYKTKETWEKAIATLALRKLPDEMFALVDDYGQHCSAKWSSVHGYMLEEMEQTKLAHVERHLHAARVQNLVQQRAEHDPALRMMRGGPAMISPMGMMPPPPGFNGR